MYTMLLQRLHKFKTPFRWLCILSCVFIVTVAVIRFTITTTTKPAIFNIVALVPAKTFAVVLGAGVSKNGIPSTYLQLRLNDALALYQNQKIKKILLTGDNSTSNYNEIGVMYQYLVARGVPPNIIYGDFAGFDTYNSFERANKVFNITDAILVTQQFHLPRSLYLAKQKNIQAVGFATNTNYGSNKYFLREALATTKTFFDCLVNRSAKFYGSTVNTNAPSNITAENSSTQLK
jgi:SanA protein